MSVDVRPEGDDPAEADDGAESDDASGNAQPVDVQSADTGTGDADATATPTDQRNGVAVHFDDGTVANYAFVVRPSEGTWLHAERLVGDGDGLDEEEVEAINVDAVRRVRSADVHVVDGCAVHCGSGLLVDPEALLAECGLAD